MNYKKSHRDQKVRPYATKAIEAGCNILEIDIQSACGKIVLGHNWRPKLPFLFDCTFEDYLKRVPAGTILQIDIKEVCLTEYSRSQFANKIAKALEPYLGKFEILVSANDGFYRFETMSVLFNKLVQCGFKPRTWGLWKIDKEITTVDLW